jgi:hypothetical protein
MFACPIPKVYQSATGDGMLSKIAELNDQLRQNLFTPGQNQVFVSAAVSSLPYLERARLLDKVQKFNDFNEDNNPYGERDFSRIEHNGTNYFWKIDYYNKTMDAGSENPADETITIRVLTIMRADEY